MEEPPSPDAWIGQLILDRYEYLGMTQADFSRKAELSDTIVREVERGDLRRRRPKNLRALSLALEWPPDALRRLLDGEDADDIGIGITRPAAQDASSPDGHSVDQRLTAVESELAVVRRGIEELLRRTGEGAPP